MPKRTAADFAREALNDGPFELEIDTGRSKKSVYPRPLSDMTYDENKEIARLTGLWATAYNQSLETGVEVLPQTPSGVAEMEPLEFRLRFRLRALREHKPTDNDPRTFVAETEAKAADYEVFRTHYWRALPWPQVARTLNAVDEYYDPTPATDEEERDAVNHESGDAAGKSSGDAG